MTLEQWYEEVKELFNSNLRMEPTETGWDWEGIYKEGLTPKEAYEDYLYVSGRI